ncbi:MAG: chemotaxis protein CheX [Lachnospiraceae bacterium]|nr:chemotaxis protein CheX [Lachnospiraceae bacterium]
MFGVYFGKYLQSVGVLTDEQYSEIVEASRTARVKMGLLAVSEGLMTSQQADEVNRLQTMQDARFGDIAIAKGYLTENQVMKLLKKQGDSYLIFVQALVERNLLTLEEIQKHLNRFKKDSRYTALDMDAIKSSDVDQVIPIFVRDSNIPTVVKDYIALLARNIVRFVDNKVRFEKIKRIYSYSSNSIASQCFTGDHELFIGLCGEGDLLIGSSYAKEEFEQVDEDCLDAVCEFINICNGLFASKLSQEEVTIDMLPPNMYLDNTTIRSEGLMFMMPVYIKNKRADIVICMETKWNID